MKEESIKSVYSLIIFYCQMIAGIKVMLQQYQSLRNQYNNMQQQPKKVSFSLKKLEQKKAHFLEGDYEESCKSYEKHRKDLDSHLQCEYYDIIACSFLMVEKYTNAKKNIEKAIQLNPSLLDLYITKAAIDYHLQLAFYEVYPNQAYQGDKVQETLKWLQKKSTNPAIFYIKMNVEEEQLEKQSLKQKIILYQHINVNYKSWKGAVPSWLKEKTERSDYVFSCEDEIIDYFQTFDQYFTFAQCQSFLDKLSCLIQLRESQEIHYGILIKEENIGLVSAIRKILNINDILTRQGWDSNYEIQLFQYINQVKRLWENGERVFEQEIFGQKLANKNVLEGKAKETKDSRGKEVGNSEKRWKQVSQWKKSEKKRQVQRQKASQHLQNSLMKQKCHEQRCQGQVQQLDEKKDIKVEKPIEILEQKPSRRDNNNNRAEENKLIENEQVERMKSEMEEIGRMQLQAQQSPYFINIDNQRENYPEADKQNQECGSKSEFQIVSTKYEDFLETKFKHNLYFTQQAYISHHIDLNFAAQSKKSIIFVNPKFIRNITPRKTLKLLQKINKEAAKLLFHAYVALCFLILELRRQGFEKDKIKFLRKLFQYVYHQIEVSQEIKYSKGQVANFFQDCESLVEIFNKQFIAKVPYMIDRRIITTNFNKITFCIHVIDEIYAQQLSERLRISGNRRKIKQVGFRQDKSCYEIITQFLIQIASGFITSGLIEKILRQVLKAGLERMVWQKPTIFSQILNKILPF